MFVHMAVVVPKMLCSALKKYGKVFHIHSRNPPDKLEYIGKEKGGNVYHEWFNGIPVSKNEMDNYYVIYLYRNPSFSILSRFLNPNHLEHIQIDKTIKLNDVLTSGKDLYKIREFYENYTKENKNRNYKIYCVKYEDIFNKQDELSNLLGIGKFNLSNKSKRKNSNNDLDKIYCDLIGEMKKNEFIIIN